MVTFRIPSQLSTLAGNQRSISVDATTLPEAFERLDGVAPMLRSQLFDASGDIRQFVGVFNDGRQIESLAAETHPLRVGSQITIVMAIAGG